MQASPHGGMPSGHKPCCPLLFAAPKISPFGFNTLHQRRSGMNKKIVLAVALAAAAFGAFAQANDTLAKAKAAGKVVTGVRESSAPLSFTLGGGQFTGYHVELCQRILKA